MKLEDIMLGEISQSQRDEFHLEEASKAVTLLEAEGGNGGCQGLGGGGNGELLINRQKVAVMQDE